MNNDFINSIFKIISKYFPEEQIVHYSGYKNKDAAYVFLFVQKHALNEYTEPEKRERLFADWVSLFLNGVPGAICTLEEFNLFFNEIASVLKVKNFLITDRGEYDPYYYIETPTEIDTYNELKNDNYENDKTLSHWEKERLDSIQREKLYALKNQEILVDLYKYIKEYFYIVSKYISGDEVSIIAKDEKRFQESIKNINSNFDLLALGFGSFSRIKSSLPIRISFTSLYSIKKDWDKVVVLDQKNSSFQDESIIKNKEKILSIDMVKELIAPIEKNIIGLLTEDSLEKVSNEMVLENKVYEFKNDLVKITFNPLNKETKEYVVAIEFNKKTNYFNMKESIGQTKVLFNIAKLGKHIAKNSSTREIIQKYINNNKSNKIRNSEKGFPDLPKLVRSTGKKILVAEDGIKITISK